MRVMNTKTDPTCEVCREHPVFKNSLCAECAEIEGETLRREYNELRDEVERLTGLLPTEGYSAIRAENWRLRAFVQKVALYSNDAWLAQEADELAPGASL